MLRFWCPWKPTWAPSRPISSMTAMIRSWASDSTRAPAESTTYTHWAPASTMVRALRARTSGVVLWASIRKPTVSMPSALASPKCWMDTSASVQCVAIRATDAPTAWACFR